MLSTVAPSLVHPWTYRMVCTFSTQAHAPDMEVPCAPMDVSMICTFSTHGRVAWYGGELVVEDEELVHECHLMLYQLC